MVADAFIALFQSLIETYGYAALFFASIVSASTVIIPLPLYVLIFFASSLGLSPLIVSIVTGVGSGIGEITGYLVGIGGRKVLSKRITEVPKQLKDIERFIKIYGFFAILIIGIIPFPFDVVGIICGASRFGIKRFLLAAIISKIIKNLMIAYLGYFTIPLLEIYLHPFFQ